MKSLTCQNEVSTPASGNEATIAIANISKKNFVTGFMNTLFKWIQRFTNSVVGKAVYQLSGFSTFKYSVFSPWIINCVVFVW